MRCREGILALALVAMAVFAGCSSSTDSSSGGALAGIWEFDSAGTVQGSYQRQLTLGNDGKFSMQLRYFGVYDGQSTDDLSGFEKTTGTFAVNGDQVDFTPEVLLEWDFSFGRDAPTQVYTDYPYDHFYDDTHFTIDGETLTLHFTDYPADEPVSSTQVFQRVQ
jgi:hypothetical protein